MGEEPFAIDVELCLVEQHPFGLGSGSGCVEDDVRDRLFPFMSCKGFFTVAFVQETLEVEGTFP